MSVKKSTAACRAPGGSGETRKCHGLIGASPRFGRKGMRHSGWRSHSQERFMTGARSQTRIPAWWNLWATIDQMSARTGS
ncbi:MAG: hypothetical protein H6Q82_2273 [Deltaproteobacteria bacterium]|nr:hypothetical protein [Deltaproteobacteria bacterium]